MRNKKHVTFSLTDEEHKRLREYSEMVNQNASRLIGGWILEITGSSVVFHNPAEELKLIGLHADDYLRLEQWAKEHHTTAAQAVADWIWKQKVQKNDEIPGQQYLSM